MDARASDLGVRVNSNNSVTRDLRSVRSKACPSHNWEVQKGGQK